MKCSVRKKNSIMFMKSNEADVVVLRFEERLEMVEQWVV